ncbi:cytochrome P450 [Pisolithus marmoratus]|nr:cytochrome P450 [Pisolithus marmoratus]
MALRVVYLPVIVATLLVLRYFLRGYAKRIPPGPSSRFLVGNLPDIPEGDARMAETYVKWRDDYGSIMHLEVFGKHMIVLNSAQAANDLMDKRAAIYSHRPRMPMLTELVGNSWVLSIISGEPHRERRSVAQRYFLAQFKEWQRVQLESSRILLQNLLDDPGNWASSVQLAVASSVLRICYGHQVTDANDVLLKIVQDALEVPRNHPYLVDVFPILKYYPSWLPGGRFKKDAAEAKVISQRLRLVPFNMVRDKMATGTASASFISTLLSQLPPDEDPETSHQTEVIRDSAAAMYGAAMDSVMIRSFLMRLLRLIISEDCLFNPKAKLDSVLDQSRLPDFDDRPSLPFIDCVILEALRWNIITPLGFPHMVIEEDEYLGYRIPKGSTVVGNTWAILRDPITFPDPENFDPCRFLSTSEGSATAREVIESTVYGWGRRTCPGRHVGYSALFIMISSILTCFDIEKALDDAGNEVVPSLKYTSRSIVRYC